MSHPGPVPESTWTQPTDRCPHPERWTAVDAQSTELEVCELVGAFVRALQPDYAVETGTCFGVAAWQIGRAMLENGHGVLDTVEIDPKRCEIARGLVADLPVRVHCGDVLKFEPVDTIGFAWFDSEIEQRVDEFWRFYDWMQPGTIVGFHDTAPHFGTWGQLVHRLPVRSMSLPTPRGVTFAEVL